VSGRNGSTPLTAMRIRRADRRDVPAIRALVAAAYSMYVQRIGRAPAPVGADYDALVEARNVWVGSVGEQVVGVLVIRAAGDALELENIAVEPDCQGRGYGRALISFAERRARALDLEAVTLYTNEAMVENLSLYPRLDFVETGRRVEDGYRRVFFRKPLDAPASES